MLRRRNVADLGRVITAMVTPFLEDGSVDYSQARALADALYASGSDGIAKISVGASAFTATTLPSSSV